MNFVLLLAQDDTLKKASDTIDVVDKLAKTGPITIALVIAIAAVAFGIWQMRQNFTMREGHAITLEKRETNAKEEGAKQLASVLEAAKERREAEKSLMREMVDRGHDANEALRESAKAMTDSAKADEALAKAMTDLSARVERRLEDLTRAIEDVRRGVGDRRTS